MLFQMLRHNLSCTFQTHLMVFSVLIFCTQFFQVVNSYFIVHAKKCLVAGSCNNETTSYRLAVYKSK
jgi:pentose-5-phosphate-3-epimerase